jgi:uncharacterized lipoprotein YajG
LFLRTLILVAATAILTGAAHAQRTDLRLAEPVIQALQAQIALQQAVLRVRDEDAMAREAAVAAHPAMNAWRWATNPMGRK